MEFILIGKKLFTRFFSKIFCMFYKKQSILFQKYSIMLRKKNGKCHKVFKNPMKYEKSFQKCGNTSQSSENQKFSIQGTQKYGKSKLFLFFSRHLFFNSLMTHFQIHKKSKQNHMQEQQK